MTRLIMVLVLMEIFVGFVYAEDESNPSHIFNRPINLEQTINTTATKYKVDDVSSSTTNHVKQLPRITINIRIQKPEISYNAQKDERIGQITPQSVNVNLQYEKLDGKIVHYSDDGVGSERYKTLNKSIQEPPIHNIPTNSRQILNI